MTFRRSRSDSKRTPETVEVPIDTLGARGDGIGTSGGRRIFVPYTLPGERVRAEVFRKTRDGIWARPLEILEPAAERVTPACRHFGDCGGCSLQHMDTVTCSAWKHERVVAALRQRGLQDAEVRATVSIPPGTRRRVVFAYKRTAKGTVLGFNTAASGRIVDQRECPLLESDLEALVGPLRGLLSEVCEPGDGGDIAALCLDGGIDLCIDLPAPPGLAALDRLTAFGRATGLVRLNWRHQGTVQPVAALKPVSLTIGDVVVSPPAGAFLQPSAEGEAALAARVLGEVGDCAPIGDLFCGIGTFALRLVGLGSVFAADGDEALVSALAATGKVETETRDLFRRPLMGKELARFAAVVFDPPRAGAAEQAAALAEAGPPAVVAVSCNPATFARDARILIDGGYQLTTVTPIDQFPWSAHVELVAAFRR